ncbi:MAG: amidohydrolase family protein [Bacteroidales bacterium]|nr:amidohydrolase family protein [Bacteroidales bacterium]
MSLFLKNATFIDWQTLDFKITNIQVDQGVDLPLQFPEIIPDQTPANHIIDCTGLLVTKSFANAHHHIYSALSRGMPPPQTPPANFHEKLKYVWWKLDKSLDLEMIEASALYAAMVSLKAGVTFVIDHHASPFAISNSLDVIAQAFDRVGLSHLLCYEVSDRDGMEKATEGLHHTENYLKYRQGLVGLHASFTVSDPTMKQAALLMQKYNSGVHIHAAEDKYDQEHCQANYSKSVVERLRDFGFLHSPKSLLVHCLHLDDNEKEILSGSKAWVVENMESNLNNKVGIFDITAMLERIMLGTDGMHSNMIRSAQYAYFAGLKVSTYSPADMYRRLRNVHHYLQQNPFKGDGGNNLVVLDYNSPTTIHRANFAGHFIYGFDASHVKHVIAGGKLVVNDRRLVLADEDEILKFARQMGDKLWERLRR